MCFLHDGSALAVLTSARDAVHAGWHLAHHPLYGNYRPHQQPYRSVLLSRDPFASDESPSEIFRVSPDPWSLRLMEAALAVYGSDRVLDPRDVPETLLRACSQIDRELMRLPIEQSGWPVNEENPVV